MKANAGRAVSAYVRDNMSNLTYQLDVHNKFIGQTNVASVPIILSSHACDPEYELVKRTWKERLLSRPWNPRRKFKQVMVALNPQMYRMRNPISGGDVIIAHTSLGESLRHLTTGVQDPASPQGEPRENQSMVTSNDSSGQETPGL